MKIFDFQQNKSKKGSALAMALVMVVIIATILTSLLSYISSQVRYSRDRVERERAFQVAEAGAYYYRWYLAHVIAGKTAAQIENFWNNENPIGVDNPYVAQFENSNGEAIGEYSLEVEEPTAGSTIVTVRSTGWTYKKPSVTRVVQVRFRRPSWSEYTFLSDSFLNFGAQATVYGKIHSNEGIRFDGVAYNTVSSHLATFNDPTHVGGDDFGVHTHDTPADPVAPAFPWAVGTVPVRTDVFAGGREFPVPEVSFTGVSTDLDAMKTQAQSGNGKYFDATGLGRRIRLKSDGTFDVCTVRNINNSTRAISTYWKNDASGWCNTCSGDCLSNYPIVNNGVIFVENSVWIEGTVNNKRITVGAANTINSADIYIGISNSNLSLAAYDCNNMLGLVAQRDLRVLDDCPSDFSVDAALLAQKGKVAIVDSFVGLKNSLTLNGAIASYLQTYFISGWGFANRTYNFNNKLLYCPPPYFPTGTEYAIDSWEEL